MANDCMVTLCVGGRTENVHKFIEILQNNYDKIHMYRIFESYPVFVNQYGMYSHAQIFCDVAWSIACTMLPGPYSYYDWDLEDHKNNKLITYINRENGLVYTARKVAIMSDFRGTHLIELARYLGLTIQAYSTEPGMAFCEDIKILPNGEKIRDYCGSYEEWWIADYKTYQDMLDDYGVSADNCPFTEEDFNNLKKANQDYYENAEVEFEDEIPDEPRYLVHNLLYKLKGE